MIPLGGEPSGWGEGLRVGGVVVGDLVGLFIEFVLEIAGGV